MTQQKNNNFKVAYALSVAWQMGFLSIVSIAGFLFVGVWFDEHFATEPYALLIGLAAGIVVTVYEMYHTALPLIVQDPEKDPNAQDDGRTD